MNWGQRTKFANSGYRIPESESRTRQVPETSYSEGPAPAGDVFGRRPGSGQVSGRSVRSAQPQGQADGLISARPEGMVSQRYVPDPLRNPAEEFLKDGYMRQGYDTGRLY